MDDSQVCLWTASEDIRRFGTIQSVIIRLFCFQNNYELINIKTLKKETKAEMTSS